MILELPQDFDPKQFKSLIDLLNWMNFDYRLKQKGPCTYIDILSEMTEANSLKLLDQFPRLKAQKKNLLEEKREVTRPKPYTFSISGNTFGQGHLCIMAGPCSVESEDQIFYAAKHISESGAKILRGGAFKPRSSPYAFQGLGEHGLKLLNKAASAYNLLTVSEIMDIDQLPLMEKYVDILQVGARNMQNYSLLKKLGRIDKPILLKRGFSSTYEEFLLSAEYILSGGNQKVILCERGIRTFENYTRNTLDIAAAPILKQLSPLPVIVDPSHGTGIRSLITPMAKAALAAGADGIMVEVHPDPEKALSDGPQSIDLEEFEALMRSINAMKNIFSS